MSHKNEIRGVAADKSKNGEESGQKTIQRTSRMALYAHRYFRSTSAVVGLIIFIVLVLWAIFGRFLTHYNYTELDFANLGAPPSAEHYFGTTSEGSDLYAMVVHGLGRSLVIAIVSSLGVTIIAAIVGTSISFFEGWFEKVGMWIVDMLMAIPSFLLIAMMVSSASSDSGWLWLIFGLTVLGWIGQARVLRTMTMSLRELDYIRASKFMGVNSFVIILRHLVPNLGSILIIDTVLTAVTTVASETSLSFLGLGIKAPDTSLGTILNEGQSAIMTQPWTLIFPSLVLIVLCFSMQMIGDGLRDALDPNSRSGGKAE
ncbi:ABC transporter permease [Alloscardovia venturai]|uniref:Oligopeptide transport system permease protein OppC n=1 Tax=Alloscardovia venturai TaxID=1769421 RepID=A0ABW2Y5R3_9BIFI